MQQPEIEMRLGVADLMARYQRLADTGKVEQLSELFLEDAVYESNTRRCEGREAILAFFRDVGKGFIDSDALPARHHLSSILVEPQPDGTAETYACFAWIGTKGLDHWGTYRDIAVQVDGSWRFRRRRAICEGHVPGSPVEQILGI